MTADVQNLMQLTTSTEQQGRAENSNTANIVKLTGFRIVLQRNKMGRGRGICRKVTILILRPQVIKSVSNA